MPDSTPSRSTPGLVPPPATKDLHAVTPVSVCQPHDTCKTEIMSITGCIRYVRPGIAKRGIVLIFCLDV